MFSFTGTERIKDFCLFVCLFIGATWDLWTILYMRHRLSYHLSYQNGVKLQLKKKEKTSRKVVVIFLWDSVKFR